MGAWILPALGAIGGMFGNPTRGTQSSTGSTTGSETVTPGFGEFSGLADAAKGFLLSRLQGGLPAGYESGGLVGINRAFRGARSNLQSSLTARGLGMSPAAAPAMVALESARAGEAGKFIAGEPMVMEQRQQQALSPIMSLLGLGRTTNIQSSGTSNTTGDFSNVAGGGLGGGLGGLGGMLGFLMAQNPNMFGGMGGTPAGTPGVPPGGF